jgi:hypothetical protein
MKMLLGYRYEADTDAWDLVNELIRQPNAIKNATEPGPCNQKGCDHTAYCKRNNNEPKRLSCPRPNHSPS